MQGVQMLRLQQKSKTKSFNALLNNLTKPNEFYRLLQQGLSLNFYCKKTESLKRQWINIEEVGLRIKRFGGKFGCLERGSDWTDITLQDFPAPKQHCARMDRITKLTSPFVVAI